MIDLEAIRQRLAAFRVIRHAALDNPRERAAQIDLLDNDVEALLTEVTEARSLLVRVLHDDKLELSDGTLGDIGDYLGTSV